MADRKTNAAAPAAAVQASAPKLSLPDAIKAMTDLQAAWLKVWSHADAQLETARNKAETAFKNGKVTAAQLAAAKTAFGVAFTKEKRKLYAQYCAARAAVKALGGETPRAPRAQ